MDCKDSIELRKNKILEIISTYPLKSYQLIDSLFFSKKTLFEIAIFFEVIGFSIAKKIFEDISLEDWSKIEELIKQNDFLEIIHHPLNHAKKKYLDSLYQRLQSHVQRKEQPYPKDPFLFLSKISEKNIKTIINSQIQKEYGLALLGILSLFKNENQILSILKAIPKESRALFLMKSNLAKKLPLEVAFNIANRYAEELRLELKNLFINKELNQLHYEDQEEQSLIEKNSFLIQEEVYLRDEEKNKKLIPNFKETVHFDLDRQTIHWALSQKINNHQRDLIYEYSQLIDESEKIIYNETYNYLGTKNLTSH